MPKLKAIFSVSYGNKFDFNKMSPKPGGIAFVSRGAKNNGIAVYVEPHLEVAPYAAGNITVALGGTLLSAFLQTQPFYTAQNIAVLTPKTPLNTAEVLYYCRCLAMNRYKYSTFGREANVTLGEIELPGVSEIPAFVKTFSVQEYGKRLLQTVRFPAGAAPYPDGEADVPLVKLFRLVNGLASSQVLRSIQKIDDRWLPYVRPSHTQETGIVEYVNRLQVSPDKIFPAGTLYVSTDGQGSHTYAYVATEPFVPNSNVTVLLPRRAMSLQEKLFYAACVTRNRYKFSYGRKPKGARLETVTLPAFPPEYVTRTDMNRIIDGFGRNLITPPKRTTAY